MKRLHETVPRGSGFDGVVLNSSTAVILLRRPMQLRFARELFVRILVYSPDGSRSNRRPPLTASTLPHRLSPAVVLHLSPRASCGARAEKVTMIPKRPPGGHGDAARERGRFSSSFLWSYLASLRKPGGASGAVTSSSNVIGQIDRRRRVRLFSAQNSKVLERGT